MDEGANKLEMNIKSKNKMGLITLFFGIFIIFAFACNNMFLGITEYYYFPITMVIYGIIYLFSAKFSIRSEHFCSILILMNLLINPLIRDNDLNKGIYFSYILYVIMFMLTTLIKFNKREIRFLVNCYIISAVIISLIIIIFRYEFNDWVGTSRYTIKTLNKEYIDPNFLAAFINIPSIICVNRILAGKSIKDTVMYMIIILIITLGVFLTGSRAAFVALFLGVSITVTCYRNKLLYVLLMSPTVGLLFYAFLPYDTIKRLLIDSYMDGSNSVRLLNWYYALKAFMKKPFFGYGIVESSSVLISLFGYKHAAHNTFLTLLLQFGILGSIPFFLIIIKIILVTLKKDMRILLGIVASILFTSLMIEANVSITLWVVLILTYIVVSYKKRNPEVDIRDII